MNDDKNLVNEKEIEEVKKEEKECLEILYIFTYCFSYYCNCSLDKSCSTC